MKGKYEKTPKYIDNQYGGTVYELLAFFNEDVHKKYKNISLKSPYFYEKDIKYSIKFKFFILIPIFNFGNFLEECFESVLKQSYDNWCIIAFDDGSTDNSPHICKRYVENYPDYFKYYRVVENQGPASTKYHGMQIIKQISDKNDIMLILDGDDYLIGNDVLSEINLEYNKYKPWITYGSFEGKWSEQTKPIPNTVMNFRHYDWIYGHPRTLKCFLLHYFEETDFKFNNRWLTKCTDRPLVFNALEWSGKERVKYIDKKLYYYREHPENTYKLVSQKEKNEQKNFISRQVPKQKVIENIHIVMCSWKRYHNIIRILRSLNNQTVSHRIHLHILNNNGDTEIKELLKNNILSFMKNYNVYIKITLRHYNNRYFGFQRFIYIRDHLLRNHIADYVIMIDDDQSYSQNWVENMYKLRKPQCYFSWWGTAFDTGSEIDYWQPRFSYNHKFDYGGTGGSIIDSSIFLDNSKLWDIPETLSVYNIEDLWLSFIITHYYDWTIYNSFLPPNIGNEYLNIVDNNSLFRQLRNEKQLLLTFLIDNYNWKMVMDKDVKKHSVKHFIKKMRNSFNYKIV